MSTKVLSYINNQISLIRVQDEIGEVQREVRTEFSQLVSAEGVIKQLKYLKLAKEDDLKIIFGGENIMLITHFAYDILDYLETIYGDYQTVKEKLTIIMEDESHVEDMEDFFGVNVLLIKGIKGIKG